MSTIDLFPPKSESTPTTSWSRPPRPKIITRVAGFIGRNWARVGYGYYIEPTWLRVNRMEVAIHGLAAAWDGLRVAQLSDFHSGPHIPPGYLEDAIERTAAERPDLITLTGDFIDRGPGYVDRAAQLFRGLKAPCGVFAVLGNHDYAIHTARGVRRYPDLHRRVTDALANEGVTVLRNQTVGLHRGDAQLLIAGIDDLWSGEANPEATFAGTSGQVPRILLAHNPQSVLTLGTHRADLILSGHTHGGQINWPGWGRLLLGKNARRWAAGLYPLPRQQHLYVNTGVGFGWRFRYGVRPEVAILTLRSA
ncbi:MAG: metallophosphoesterase [Gemmataceae bacterium]|nr:metallophosphoesterase [Gemmata sp.]MDW8199302.1 metallophosphoesterase [Gemmataceae bacterium]